MDEPCGDETGARAQRYSRYGFLQQVGKREGGHAMHRIKLFERIVGLAVTSREGRKRGRRTFFRGFFERGDEGGLVARHRERGPGSERRD